MRALLLLNWLNIRARLRRSVRGARTVKGALFLALGVFVLVLWIGPAVLSAHVVQRADPQRTLAVVPLILLGMFISNLVSSAGERAVAFSPAEVDLLFAAPFTRRQLLIYKIARSAVAAVTVSLLFSALFLRYASSWLAAFVGSLLSLLLLQLLGMAAVLVGQTVGERAYTRGRRLVVLLVLVVLALSALPLLKRPERAPSLFGVASQLRDATAGKIVLAPFVVFAHVLAAQNLAEMARWCGAAVAILAALLAAVLVLDAHYLELSAAAGQRLYDRVQHARRTGSTRLRMSAGAARLRVPMPPRLGGAGPIAWRQLTTALRQSRSLLILLLLISLAAAPGMYAGGITLTSPGALAGVVLWMSFMLANTLRFDFRGDVDHMDVLKALPIAPSGVVVAQLVAPVTVMTALQLVLLLGACAIFEIPLTYLLAAALFALPLNAMMFAIENLIFLTFPGRYAAGPGDLQGFGRQMVVFMMKLILLMLGALVALGAGAIANALTRSWPIAIATGVVALWLEVIALVPLLTAAYVRYDVSADTPV
jgi:hypothetical protein